MLLNILPNVFAKPSKLLMGAALSMALAACGGGGGSPGEQFPAPTPQAATVELSVSAATISGIEEVTLVATAKDRGNNALAGATVVFNASSGTIAAGTRITDALGQVTTKLNTEGNPVPRDIIVSASVGSAVSAQKKVTVVAVP